MFLGDVMNDSDEIKLKKGMLLDDLLNSFVYKLFVNEINHKNEMTEKERIVKEQLLPEIEPYLSNTNLDKTYIDVLYNYIMQLHEHFYQGYSYKLLKDKMIKNKIKPNDVVKAYDSDTRKSVDITAEEYVIRISTSLFGQIYLHPIKYLLATISNDKNLLEILDRELITNNNPDYNMYFDAYVYYYKKNKGFTKGYTYTYIKALYDYQKDNPSFISLKQLEINLKNYGDNFRQFVRMKKPYLDNFVKKYSQNL